MCAVAIGLCLSFAHLPAQTAKPAESTFRVGLKTIAVPAPSTELNETGPDYRVLLDNLTPTNNRLVAAFLLPDELKALQTSTTHLSRYALVQVPRRAEFADVGTDLFKDVLDSLAKQFDAELTGSLKDQQDEINRRLKAMGQGSTSVTLDKPVMLGSFYSKPDATCYGAIMPVQVNDKTTRMVMAMGVVRVQERILFLYLYAPYVDETTVTWARTTSEHWADATLAANK